MKKVYFSISLVSILCGCSTAPASSVSSAHKKPVAVKKNVDGCAALREQRSRVLNSQADALQKSSSYTKGNLFDMTFGATGNSLDIQENKNMLRDIDNAMRYCK